MEEYADIYYLDDTRNAMRDHRVDGQAGYRRPATARPTRAMVVPQPAAPAPARVPAYVPQQPMYYAPQPVAYGEPSPTAGSILGRLTIAQIIELAAQAFAALQSLPPPPNPTEATSTNVANLILYQTALAQHAKRDEQVRTLGSLVARLAG